MVFSSAVFLFFFLPIIFLLNRIPSYSRVKNWTLIVGSLLFYAFGEPVYVCIMLISVAVNYVLGRLAATEGRRAKIGIFVALCFNLGMLGIFKYTDFIIKNINSALGTMISQPHIALPIGISFFTFQAMSYVVDVYREKELCQKSFEKLLLYICFFPQLVAGPIVKYKDIQKQLDNRVCTSIQTAQGLQRFTVGLGKKLFIANTMGQTADFVFSLGDGQINMPIAWLGAVCYTLQIYYDFSGYSDMAIGLGKIFGFHYKENFNYPYSSKSIKEFWRRWHISLSTWFRDYLYIPLGGNRRGMWRTGINKLTVFFATGLWHGANWTFVLWGLVHGLFLVVESSRFFVITKNRIVGRIYTMLVVITAFVLFRAETVSQAGFFIGQMYTGFHFEKEVMNLLIQQLTPLFIVTLAAGILFSQPVGKALKERFSKRKVYEYAVCGLSLALLVLCFFNLSASTFNPFIYFRF